jgi:hypothetical protein
MLPPSAALDTNRELPLASCAREYLRPQNHLTVRDLHIGSCFTFDDLQAITLPLPCGWYAKGLEPVIGIIQRIETSAPALIGKGGVTICALVSERLDLHQRRLRSRLNSTPQDATVHGLTLSPLLRSRTKWRVLDWHRSICPSARKNPLMKSYEANF